jgi:hypothetical protein
MSADLILSNLLNPPVLFFFLGMAAVWLGSDLDVPQPLPRFFSLYLLLAIGFKGGVELARGGLPAPAVATLAAAVAMSFLCPLYVFALFRRRGGFANAAAVAATYGSVSAVTFVAGTALLGKLGIPYGGHLVAALALMESPAVIVTVALYRREAARAARADAGGGGEREGGTSLAAGRGPGTVVREALVNASVFLLLGSLFIGLLTGEDGARSLKPFTEDLFRGLLSLFLLDMGLVSARRFADLRDGRAAVAGFAILVPLINAAAAIGIARAIGVSPGDAFLFTVLCASASYIAVPAALRLTIPDANPGLYVTMALGVTFPFNVLLGFPLYLAVIRRVWGM